MEQIKNKNDDAAVHDAASDLFFPSEEARLFSLQGAKDALSGAGRPTAAPGPAYRRGAPRRFHVTIVTFVSVASRLGAAPPQPGARASASSRAPSATRMIAQNRSHQAESASRGGIGPSRSRSAGIRASPTRE